MFADEKKRKSLINLSTIIVGLTLIALLIGYSFAWLTDIINKRGGATIGEVKIEIYDGNTKLNGVTLEDGSYVLGEPYALTLNSKNTKTLTSLKIKNTGNIDGIVRCFVTVSTNEGPKDHYTDLDGALFLVHNSQVSSESPDWVDLYDNPLLEGNYAYNMFLNKVLAPNAENLVFTSLTALDTLEGTTVYIRLRADIVAYSGNAYQIDSAENPVADKEKPFGVLSEEFLNRWTAYR